MKEILVLILALPYAIVMAQQNLVPNGGFEEFHVCPNCFNSVGEFDGFCANWYTPTNGTPDFYHSCAYDSAVLNYCSIPTYDCGYYPKSGQGMAGLILHSGGSKEYISIQLSDSLMFGSHYLFNIRVRKHCQSIVSIGSIGAFLSSESIYDTISSGGGFNELSFIPQFQRNPIDFMHDSNIWYENSDTIEANGGERHLTIGNFLPYSQTPTQPTPANFASYYYVDDISLTLLDTNTAIVERNDLIDFSISPNPASELVNIKVNGVEQIGLHIKDQLGRALLSQRSLQKEQTINVAFLHAGVYFVEVVMKDGVVVRRRFIKE